MALTDILLIWVHLVTASIWVGGSIFLGIVLAPMLKSITGTLEDRIALMIKIGRRFNKIAMPSFMILVIATLITYIIHIRILNAETEKTLSAGNAESIYVQSIRSKIIHLGRITVILSVTILLLAAFLDSGGILVN
jgi:uncharacterized membrane protein